MGCTGGAGPNTARRHSQYSIHKQCEEVSVHPASAWGCPHHSPLRSTCCSGRLAAQVRLTPHFAPFQSLWHCSSCLPAVIIHLPHSSTGCRVHAIHTNTMHLIMMRGRPHASCAVLDPHLPDILLAICSVMPRRWLICAPNPLSLAGSPFLSISACLHCLLAAPPLPIPPSPSL